MKLFLSAVLSVFIFVNPSFSQQRIDVKGIIRNSATNEPVSNANITVINTQSGTSSGTEGHFVLQLTPGEHKIRITSVGFAEKLLTVRVPNEKDGFLQVQLRPQEQEIEGIDVFGNYFIPGRDTAINRIPLSILPAMTTVSAAEIEKQGAVTLVDALKFVPGGWTETRGRKTKQFFAVRGQKYPYPEYSINGIWQKEFEETGYFMSALDIESVEIIRSGSALVKGLSGLTGVVDIKIKKPVRETLSFMVKYGELNNHLTNLQYGNKINDLSFNASASFFGTDGIPGKNGKERIGNLYGNIGWNINKKLELLAGATYIRGLRQLVMIDNEVGAPNIKNRIEKYDPVGTLLTYAKLNYSGNDGSLTELQTNVASRKVDFASYNIPQETTTWNKENDWELGLNVLHSQPLSAFNTLRIGGLYNHWVAPEGKRYYVGRSSNVHTFSGVVADEQKVGRFLFDAGFRLIGGYIVEWGGFGIEGSAAGFQNVAPIEDQAAPLEVQSAVGATYGLSGSVSVHYNISGGTIAPRKGSLTDEGILPDNEGRFQHDLGFRYISKKNNELSLSAFYTQRKNSIDFSGQTIVTENDLVMELYKNIDKLSYGIEVSSKLNVPSIHSYIFGNAMIMNGKRESASKMIKDNQLPGIVLNTGIYFDYKNIDANFFMNYTGPYTNNRFVIPSWVQQHGDFPLGDFVSADFTAGYTFTGKYTTRIFMDVKNIMDKNYMTVAGYPDLGRVISGGLRIKK